MKNRIKKNIKNIYGKYAGEFDKKIGSLTLYQDSYDYLLGKIEADASILDMACGPGNVSNYLKKYRPDLTITGVDISEEMIEIAKSRIEDGRFIVMDISDIRFKAEFDCVVCAFAIPYLSLEETCHAAKIIHRSMKRNGLFYISFMNGEKEGFENTSFTGNDELYIYYHPQEAVRGILNLQSLSVTKEFVVDYHEMDGTITKEIIYTGIKTGVVV